MGWRWDYLWFLTTKNIFSAFPQNIPVTRSQKEPPRLPQIPSLVISSLFSCLAIHVSKHASREAQLHPHATPLPGLRPIYNTWMACTSLVPALGSQMSVEAAQVQVKCSGACNSSRPNVPRNREVSALLSALRALIMCTTCIVHLRTLASFVKMVYPL